MKQKVIILTLLFLVLETARSQDLKMCGYQGYQTVEAVESACQLEGAEASGTNVEVAEKVVDDILDKVGLFRNFYVEECDNINNALAVTMPMEGGAIDRYILYDQQFFDKVSSSTGTDWGNASILAHEVGHHLNGHTLSGSGSTHQIELQADEFSGFVLARMGCPLEDAQSAVSNLLPDEASATHPAKQNRLDAISKGWHRGSGKKIEVPEIKKEVIENKVVIVNKEDITAEMVLANYLEAIGGQEKILGVKTMIQKRESASKTLTSNIITKMTFESPLKMITETYTNGENTHSMIQKKGGMYTYSVKNGMKTWGKVLPMKTDMSSVSYFLEYANLVNPQGLEYLGIEELEGEKYHVVALSEIVTELEIMEKPVISKMRYINYYHAETGLLYLTDMQTKMTSSDKEINEMLANNSTKLKTYFSDYREVSGILMPYETRSKNAYGETIIEMLSKAISIEINPTIDPTLFETPKD